MSNHSTKPYLIRSIYEWCIDSNFTPFISVKVYSNLDIPNEYIKNGEVVFNIGEEAVHNLIISNETISFMARFNGISRKLEISINTVKGIFAKEVNQGIAFSLDNDEENQQNNNLIPDSLANQTKNISKSKLRIVK